MKHLTKQRLIKGVLCAVLAAVTCLSFCSCSLLGALVRHTLTPGEEKVPSNGESVLEESVDEQKPTADGDDVQKETMVSKPAELPSEGSCAHEDTEWQEIIAATCTVSGTKELTCLSCKEVIKVESIPAAHAFEEGKCTVCGEKDPEYVVPLEEINVPAIGNAPHSIPALAVKDYTVSAAEMIVYNGNISKTDQVDSYTYIAKIGGRIRVQMSEVYAGKSFELYVLDRLGQIVARDTYCVNGDGLTLDVNKGEAYTIRLCQDEGYSTYKMTIGQQKPAVNLTSYTKVKDSVEFIDQQNVYTFTAPINGRYRFQVTDVKSGIAMEMHAYNKLGERLAYDSYLINGDGLTLDLTKGETYTLYILQKDQFGSYTLCVGNQKAAVNVTAYNQIKDSVEFIDQQNVYTLTAPRTGVYNIGISGLKAGVSCMLYVYDELDQRVQYDSYFVNGDNLQLRNLEAGKTYTIYLVQKDNFGEYTLSIGVQKQTVQISSLCKISDSMQFAGQTNYYLFTADEPGTHNLVMSGLEASAVVEVYVYNSLGEVVKKDTYCVNGDVISLGDFTMGVQFAVAVVQNKGLSSYILTVE